MLTFWSVGGRCMPFTCLGQCSLLLLGFGLQQVFYLIKDLVLFRVVYTKLGFAPGKPFCVEREHFSGKSRQAIHTMAHIILLLVSCQVVVGDWACFPIFRACVLCPLVSVWFGRAGIQKQLGNTICRYVALIFRCGRNTHLMHRNDI